MEVVKDGRRKSPRKWNSDLYPKSITVRVTLEEHQQIGEWADRVNLSHSRYLVTKGLGRRLPPLRDTMPASPDDRRQIEFLMIELRKIGVNLNQLAKNYNRARIFGHSGPSSIAVERASSKAEALLRILKNRL